MTSNESVLPIPQLNKDLKQNNVGQKERRNRRVLGNIGNLAPTIVVEAGKPTQISRPITRNYCAQLAANAHGAAGKNVKIQKPQSETNNGEEVVLKNQEETPRRRAKKPSKSLTAVLSARSKVACGITSKPKDPVVNIDESDINNELAEVEYVEDIYKFYKLSETEGGLQDYMNSQPELNAKMRGILIDWLIEVHRKFNMMPESLYLTINIVDRYLSMRKVARREFQLVGMSAMLIACKYEEIWPPEVNDLIAISDNAYSGEQILVMEKAILGQLGWYLTVPTPYVFLVRYTKASIPSDDEMENMVFFLTDLGLIHYSVIIANNPSKLAAAAVYAARSTLNKTPVWTETLKHHTGYYEEELRECAKMLVSFHASANEAKLKAVYRKYVNPERGAVALFPPARSLLAEVVVAGASS
ncbi:putative cyclin [Helianthus annuus]|uniref:Cyclin n=1 Tax=Helianthus annuus TaxID=4232 RepID=A0A251VBA9_HELAN|nr:G2/mitotic-specific cyclin S13-7 [Helianthus annuus]KAF5816521.1 putative cyclin [Helianthus annuus]KAJ0594766.1 putative cyclin domain-containing protein [Helianthus annuus]KAJ0603058.1 putative cyclin domain-containing protein [Helianthus annuus]